MPELRRLAQVDVALDELTRVLGLPAGVRVVGAAADVVDTLMGRLTLYVEGSPLCRSMISTPVSVPLGDLRASGDPTCSFCGKPRVEVRFLVAASSAAYLCDECLDQCVELAAHEGAE